jgi:AcrR family transcriptional regulator
LLASGARALTVDAIAAASGAPVGSLYHRFGSLEGLLAEMWIASVQRFQVTFLAAAGRDVEPLEAAVGAAVAVHDFARDQPADAGLLAALRREDLVAAAPPQLLERLESLNQPAERALATLSRRLYGNAGPTALARTRFAVADLPVGAVRGHLMRGTPFPRGLRTWVEAAARAALQ